MGNSLRFFNRCFNKTRLKNFILWFFKQYGEQKTVELIEDWKKIGFKYATEAGISIGIDDLKIPLSKPKYINLTEQKIKNIETNTHKGNLTEIERRQFFVDEWNFISEKLKNQVIQFFKSTNAFNPVYMMAFSGARGNISQIRQLVGMRGLMVDPQGQILDFPIRSNFREGLTLIEYLISCYGARKGVVDTALRTATSGYLTRRLVDVTQQVIIGRQNCNTKRGIQFTNLVERNRILLHLRDRLVGRILLDDLFEIDSITKTKSKIGSKNQEISSNLSLKISQLKIKALIRSPLTCYSKNSVCQLCYGWNLAYGKVVSIGEAIGVIAAQSIGEPGTQLTMRTFHTGGIFTGALIDQIYAPFNGRVDYLTPFNGLLIRTLKGKIGFLTKTNGRLQVKKQIPPFYQRAYKAPKSNRLLFSNQLKQNLIDKTKTKLLIDYIQNIELNFEQIQNTLYAYLVFNIPVYTILLIRQKGFVLEKELIAEFTAPSFFPNQQQGTEQEIFSPISGQVFFENLVLIEKLKRGGAIQKIAYGLGSAWIIEGQPWSSGSEGGIFPLHGDFLESSSIVQKIQILAERLYTLNSQLFVNTQTLSKGKLKSFSINKTKYYSKPKQLNNIIFNRQLAFFKLKKIYYQKIRYYLLSNYESCFLIPNSVITIHFLSYFFPLISHIKKYNKKITQFIGLYSSLSQNHPRLHRKKRKSSFLLCSIYNTRSCLNKQIFFNIQLRFAMNFGLKKPIFSRKNIDFNNPLSQNYQFWANLNFLITFKKPKIRSHVSMYWLIYAKNNNNFQSLIFDIELPNYFAEQNNFKSQFLKKHKTTNYIKIAFQKNSQNLIYFKHFLNSASLPECFINYTCLLNYSFYQRLNWISFFQTIVLFLNRQGNIKLQFFKSWTVYKTFFNYLDIKNYSTNTKINDVLLLGRKLKYKSNLSFFPPAQNRNYLLKPILLNLNLIKQHRNNHKILNYYIIQKFFIDFYYSNSTPLEFSTLAFCLSDNKNLKIGLQAQIKINVFPLMYHKDKNLKLKKNLSEYSKLKILTKKPAFLFLNLHYEKQQNFSDWVCVFPHHRLLGLITHIIYLGVLIQKEIHYDNQKIALDFVFGNCLFKLKMEKNKHYKHIRSLKKYFLVLYSQQFILFHKVKNRIKVNNSFFKRGFSNQNLSSALVFNNIINYYQCFQKTSLVATKVCDVYFLQPAFSKRKNKMLQKNTFIQNLFIKILVNYKYSTNFESYSPIFNKTNKNYIFEKQQPYCIKKYNDLLSKNLITLTSKQYIISFVKNIQFKSTNLSPTTFKVCYQNFDLSFYSNIILIKLFFPFQNGEVIYPRFKSKKLNFIILTRANLKAFLLHQRFNQLKIGDLIRYSNVLEDKTIITDSGQIIYSDTKKIIFRNALPFLLTPKSILNISQNQNINKGTRLFKFFYQQIKTGDIIQGIPKIEEFFEARSTRKGEPLRINLHTQLKNLFKTNRLNFSLIDSTQKSFEAIQKLIIDEIQKIYCSQGIYIADKHLEIVIRQMTSKVKIIDGGQTGLLCGELVEFDWIRSINQSFLNEKILYEPIILGITKSCLETESFIAAASFQETTRILTKAAIQNKVDFIRGLKQNVVLGNLIPAGTGFFSSIYFKYLKSKNTPTVLG